MLSPAASENKGAKFLSTILTFGNVHLTCLLPVLTELRGAHAWGPKEEKGKSAQLGGTC